ncbi:MAG: tripartite tricarboxylate transporter substrate binding protein, partial [Xanthobacteraceae bacterium]
VTGADIVFVPYKSAAQAATDVLAGQMNMTFEGTTAIVPHVKSGEVRALAVTSSTRIPEIPDVPTMDELGYLGMPPDSWQAIVAPAGTPPDIVAKLNKAVNDGLANPQFRDKIIELGGTPEPRSVADFAAYIPAQYKRWGEVIRITGVQLDQ